jgi:hypothetical protein
MKIVHRGAYVEFVPDLATRRRLIVSFMLKQLYPPSEPIR